MNTTDFFRRIVKSTSLYRLQNISAKTTSADRQVDRLQVEALEPRMMLNGDPGVVLFEAGFEDADVAAGQFAFFNNVSGFTALRPVEIQNSHPAVGPAAEGGRLLELDGNNEIFVDIRDVSAASLTLDLQYSPRGGAGVLENEIEVIWNGAVVETLSADGTRNSSTQFRRVSIELPVDDGSSAGRLEFRSKFSGSRGLGGLLDDISVTATLSPLVIENVSDQTVAADSSLAVDVDLSPADNTLEDVRFEVVTAPVGATLNARTGLFRWQATAENISATQQRATTTVVSQPQVIVFADFEDVEVGGGQFGFFDELSGFTATRRTVEVQNNHPAVGPASSGNQHVELDGVNGLARDVATNLGDRYELTFDFSPRAGADAETNAIEVLWDGRIVRTVTADGRGNRSTDYRTVTVSLPAGSGDDTRLEFRSRSAGTGPGLGGLIDNVRVTQQSVSTETSANPFEVVVRSRDGNGRSDSETFNITISDVFPDEVVVEVPAEVVVEPPVEVVVEAPAEVVEEVPVEEVGAPPVDVVTPPLQIVVEAPAEEADAGVESLPATAIVRADYRDDYQAGTPASNWQYLWNAPEDWNGTSSTFNSTGGIGDPENYVPLLAFNNDYTPTGNAIPNVAPANFLRLDEFGGHPGAGQFEQSSGNVLDRYAIAAWTVDEDGFYAITDSFLTTLNVNANVDVLVHVNDNDPAIRRSAVGAASESFDTRLGYLEQGDVIYVAFGPEDAQSFDSFQHDFSIVQLAGADFSVLVSNGQTSVFESGQTDSFDVVLHQRPTDDVVIQFANSSTQEVSLSTQTLIFTADNWNVSQSVTLTAIDDSIEDGLQPVTITTTVDQENSAAEYRTSESQLVSVSVVDDETVVPLQDQIDAGLEAGLEEIILTPGVYESVARTPSSPHLSISGAEDVTIVADGVTLLATSLSSAVRIQNANNVTLTGLTIDYDPLPFSQGTVVGVAGDRSYFDVQIHDGYELLPDGSTTRAIIHDSSSRLVKSNTFTRFGSSVTALDARTVRISNRNQPDALVTGDLVSFTRDTLSPHAVSIDRSNSVRLEDVTVHASTAFAFYETESGGNEYYNLTVTPGATPEGETEARLLSSNFDSFHSKYATTGPKIVGARFDSAGDDGIAINGDFALVARDTDTRGEPANSVLISSKRTDPRIRVGDQLSFGSKDSDVFVERTVLAVERYDVGDVDFDAIGDIYFDGLALPQDKFETGYRVTLSQSVDADAGDLITNLSRSGAGFEISDSVIANTRARGLVLKASDGIVSGNTITNVALTGILIAPEAKFWAESGFADSLVIDNNRLSNVGFTFTNPSQRAIGGIVITADPEFSARGHRDIQISNNELERVNGINLVVTNALDVDVFGNQFIDAQPLERNHGTIFGVDPGALVWLDLVNDISFRSNGVDGLGDNTDHLVLRSSTVTNVAGLSTGLRINV